MRFPHAPQHKPGWRLRYDDATDPRKSVMRRLIGLQFPVGGSYSKGQFLTENEWGSLSEEEDDWSDVESIDGSSGLSEEADISVLLDRPCTPPPQTAPLGPALLDCRFHHSHLIPHSRPLHPPSPALAATGLQGVVPTISVPTPVSPPAILGEKLKSWEAAAGILVREVVENSAWADSWLINNQKTFRTSSYGWCVCQGDVSQLAAALGTLDDTCTPLEIGTLFDLGMIFMNQVLFY